MSSAGSQKRPELFLNPPPSSPKALHKDDSDATAGALRFSESLKHNRKSVRFFVSAHIQFLPAGAFRRSSRFKEPECNHKFDDRRSQKSKLLTHYARTSDSSSDFDLWHMNYAEKARILPRTLGSPDREKGGSRDPEPAVGPKTRSPIIEMMIDIER
jgi:hypothetical protein